MDTYSNDRDLLIFEPALFITPGNSAQILCRGSGAINAMLLTDTAADFFEAGLGPGNIVTVTNAETTLTEAYEIISMESATQMQISVLRPGTEAAAVAPTITGQVTYQVASYSAATAEAAIELTGRFAIQPGDPQSPHTQNDIINPQVFRHASIFLIIANIYQSMAIESAQSELYQAKHRHYRQLYDMAIARIKVGIDLDDDGQTEKTLDATTIRLERI